MMGTLSPLGLLLSVCLAAPTAAPPAERRAVAGPGSAPWPADRSGALEVETPQTEQTPTEATAPPVVPAPERARPKQSRVVRVAVGLDPTAPGSRAERD